MYKSYFDLLRETLEKADVIEKPAQIYNCDEFGMPLEPQNAKNYYTKGHKESSATFIWKQNPDNHPWMY